MNYLTLKEKDKLLDELEKLADNSDLVGSRRLEKIRYWNIPISFDIETSSFINEKKEKCGIMYVWQMAIGEEIVVIGRNWDEYKKLMYYLKVIFEVSKKKRLAIYVHNLSYEFQWLKTKHNFIEVLALNKRRPRLALTDEGFEFRCSYILSGYSLANLPLYKYKVEKKTGDLDYSLIRHSKTPLTKKEIGYCINDVKKVVFYIKECMERDGSIADILQTKTSYVRSLCRRRLFPDVWKEEGV